HVTPSPFVLGFGILLVGMKLYERGASLGQVMAFLIASPWNSLSLTLIMVALMGLKWTLVFMGLSMVIAILSGLVFERLVAAGVLPSNPNTGDKPDNFHFFPEAKKQIKQVEWKPSLAATMLKEGFSESAMVLRWVFLGVVLAALIRTFVPTDQFAHYFGATLSGLGLTIIAATIIEVCSEGSTPIAADLLNRAKAPGNSFAFLMTGVATDYTEIMGIKETMKSWKIAFFLPLVTLPQVITLSWMINQIAAANH
ncbi:MAG: permease, partial [Rickettsiales bacterium]